MKYSNPPSPLCGIRYQDSSISLIPVRKLYLQVDYEMAMEYATQSGVKEEPREDIYVQSLDADHKYMDFHSPVFVFRFIQ